MDTDPTEVYLLMPSKDEKLKKILKHIAKNPVTSGYKIAEKTRIPRNVVIRKIEQYRLVEKGMLKRELKLKGKRVSKPFSLTFLGLLYALKVGAIQSKNIAKARTKSQIPLPLKELEDTGSVHSLIDKATNLVSAVEIAENIEPEIFYTLLKEWIDPETVKPEFITLTCLVAGLLTLSFLTRLKPEGELRLKRAEFEHLPPIQAYVRTDLLDPLLLLMKPFMSLETQKLINEKLHKGHRETD